MPHCVIEYSQSLASNILPSELIEIVSKGAEKSGLFEIEDIKVRAMPYMHHSVGGNISADFVHITVRILSGRTQTQKQRLSQFVFEPLSEVLVKKVSLTVEIVEIDRESYLKS